MKRMLATVAIAGGMIAGMTGTANAAWKPTLTPLTLDVKREAQQDQWSFCNRAGLRRFGPVTVPNSVEIERRARCNPFDARARKFSSIASDVYAAALREGWCFRWLGNSEVGTPVSVTCITTVKAG